jgi:hypothetical protein
MWWYVIGNIIGGVWREHEEKKHPEILAKRQIEEAKAARDGWIALLIIIALIIVGIVVVSVVDSTNLSIVQSTGPAKISPTPNSPVGQTPAISTPEAKAPTPVAALEVSPAPPPAGATAPEVSPTPSPPAIPDASPLPKPETLAEPSYQGTADTNFAKDWVIVDGVKMQGITFANPAPGGQVAIIYSDGGRNVPASSLPQGFLDAWKLTPEKFKAVGNQ